MLPGITSKLSEQTVTAAATILQKSDIIILKGATSLATIRPNFGGGFSGICILIPVDGAVATLTTGNIAVAQSMAQNLAVILVYSKSQGKWYPAKTA